MHSMNNSDTQSNNQLRMISQLNKKHEILTVLQLCKSHLKIQQYNSVVSTDILINNYLYLINNLNYKPFQVIWNLSKIYQQKDLYHLACNLLKEYLDANESKIKYEDPFDEFMKQDISLHDLQLIQLDSDDQDQDDLIISEVWASLGHCYLMIEDLPNAYLTYQKALYILPNVKCSKLWKGIGILYDRYGSLDYAEEAFAKVLEIENFNDTTLKEDQNEIYFRLGIIYKHQLKFHQSLECFRFIIYNPPAPLKECDIWFQLGQVCELMKDYENAKLAYTECCLLNNNHHKAWSCLAVIYLILQENKINRMDEQKIDINLEIQQNREAFYEDTTMALQCLNNHTNIDSTDLMSWYYSGRAYLLLKDYQVSYEYYQNCINKDPNNGNFWCSIGILYYAIGQFHDALDAYSRAIRLNPYLWEVWYDLGILYESCGDDEQQLKDAIDAFTQADRLKPGYPAIEMKLKFLVNKEPNANDVQLPKWIEPELPFQQPNAMNSETGDLNPLNVGIQAQQHVEPVTSNEPISQKQEPNMNAYNNQQLPVNNMQQQMANPMLNKGLESLVAAAAMSHPAKPGFDNNNNVTSSQQTTTSTGGAKNAALPVGPKKRGRKPKNANATAIPANSIPVNNTGSISSNEETSTQPTAGIKKRGRPLGRKNKVHTPVSGPPPSVANPSLTTTKNEQISTTILQNNPIKNDNNSVRTSVNPLIGNAAPKFPTLTSPVTVNISNMPNNIGIPVKPAASSSSVLHTGKDRLPVFNSVSNKNVVQPISNGGAPKAPKVIGSAGKGVKINLADLAAVSEQQQKQKDKASNPLLNLVNAVESSNKLADAPKEVAEAAIEPVIEATETKPKEEEKNEKEVVEPIPASEPVAQPAVVDEIAPVSEQAPDVEPVPESAPKEAEKEALIEEPKKNPSPSITEEKTVVEKPLLSEESKALEAEEEEVKDLPNQIHASVEVVMRNMDEDDNYDD